MNQWELDNWTYRHLLNEVELMKGTIDAYKRKVLKQHVVDKLVEQCEERLFNAALNLGDFELAMEYANTLEKRKLITRLAMAFIRKPDEDCNCIGCVLPGGAELPKHFLWRRIFDKKKGVWTDIYKCSDCNFMTIAGAAKAKGFERVKHSSEKKTKDDDIFKKL